MRTKNKISIFIILEVVLLLNSCIATKESSRFIESNNCKLCDEFLVKKANFKIDSIFTNNSNYCINYYIIKGDSILNTSSFITLNLVESINYYKKALVIDSSNQEVLFKISYLYDLMDSTDSARYYYNKVNEKYLNLKNRFSNQEFPEINVSELKKNFLYNDSLLVFFIKYGKQASITFDFEYDYSGQYLGKNFLSPYIDKIFDKKVYLTIFGNGEFESRDYYGFNNRSTTYIKGKLPDSLLFQILRIFGAVRFLTFQNLFYFDELGINRFYYNRFKSISGDIEGPIQFERITIKTSKYSHSIGVLGLDETELPKSGKGGKNITDKKTKLNKLSDLWMSIFNRELQKYQKE